MYPGSTVSSGLFCEYAGRVRDRASPPSVVWLRGCVQERCFDGLAGLAFD